MLTVTLIFGAILDCNDVITLATGLNMDRVQPLKMNAIIDDCCNSAMTGVICGERVENIDWGHLGLNGTLNMTAVPLSTKLLFLFGNQITGSVSHISPDMELFEINWNQFEGTIPPIPNRVRYAYFHGNKFTGNMPEISSSLEDFICYDNKLNGTIPDSLSASTAITGLNCGNNQFTGQLPTLPSTLVGLLLYDNLLTGSLPALSSSLYRLLLQNNLLTGSLPMLPSNIGLVEIQGNFFTGNLPFLPSTILWFSIGYPGINNTNKFTGSVSLYKPERVLLNGNWISDLFITDNTSLTYCDISETGLLGKTSELSMCTQNDLYTLASTTISVLPMSTLDKTIASSMALESMALESSESEEYALTIKSTIESSTSSALTSIRTTLNSAIKITRNGFKSTTTVSAHTVGIAMTTIKQLTTVASSRINQPELFGFTPLGELKITFTISSVLRLVMNSFLMMYIIVKVKNLARFRKRKTRQTESDF